MHTPADFREAGDFKLSLAKARQNRLDRALRGSFSRTAKSLDERAYRLRKRAMHLRRKERTLRENQSAERKAIANLMADGFLLLFLSVSPASRKLATARRTLSFRLAKRAIRFAGVDDAKFFETVADLVESFRKTV